MPSYLNWIARVFLLGLAAFAFYYPYKLFFFFLPFAFSGPESWQHHWMVEDHVLVPLWLRTGHFLLWMPTAVATVIMIVSAIWLVMLLLRGVFFEQMTVRALQRIGIWAAVAGLTGIVGHSLDAWILTSQNDEYIRSPRLWLESGEVGVLLVGLGLYLLARILRVAAWKEHENKEFV